ncbi:hypothetical protein CFBP2044_32010 [Xanthomonas hortorum pv. cynarae]|nr:hypothetical protein CFBP2044_32010 [Xanthomonas hortorum pv. cynarae]CAD0346771.1 hypothetical protein CFBP2044_32010 [Xanthomonas hortorum pv. cynarae]
MRGSRDTEGCDLPPFPVLRAAARWQLAVGSWRTSLHASWASIAQDAVGAQPLHRTVRGDERGLARRSLTISSKSGQQSVASTRQVRVDGVLRTAVYKWYMPIPSTCRARLAVSAVVLFAALKEAVIGHVAARRPDDQTMDTPNSAARRRRPQRPIKAAEAPTGPGWRAWHRPHQRSRCPARARCGGPADRRCRQRSHRHGRRWSAITDPAHLLAPR